MEFSAQQIAGLLDGQIVGNPDVKVSGLSKIEEGVAGTLSFLANPKYEDFIYSTKASIVIVNKSFEPQKPLADSTTLIKVEEAYSCFAKLLGMYDQALAKQPQIEEKSFISPTAKIGKDVYIGAFAYISDHAEIGDGVHIYPNTFVGDHVKIGNNSKLFANVSVYRDCKIGQHCTIHSGSVIGADGFGFAPNSENNYQKVPQIGNVILEDHVEVGANTCIDRATLGSTIIKKGVKLDNLVQIGHNVVVGENTVMAAQGGIAGSTKLGKNMMVGGQVGIVGHISLADGTMIGAQAGVPKTITKEGTTILGSPAYDAEDYKKSYMGFRRLPQILDRLRELEEEVKKIKKQTLISMAEKQKTLAGEIKLSGVGLHTGELVNLTICPAPAKHGYKFQRVDLESKPVIKADPDNVVSTARGTTLEEKGAKVYTTEHVLAALYAMQIDNALIQLDAPEVPIMDGSAQIFVNAIRKVGLVEQDAEREYLELDENIKWEDPEKGTEFLAVPDKEYRVTVMVDYNSPVLGTQHASMFKIGDFEKEIAPCRTFCFLKELEYLATNGLIKGGDLDNAIVLVERADISNEELDRLAKILGKERLSISVNTIGTLNNTKLHFENEPARHKLLDIIGDLALVGKPLRGHILAARPGHGGNVKFAKILKEHAKKALTKPKLFDLDREPLYDTVAIEKMLPHRYPFLLVDKIMEITDDTIIGVKNVTMNEPQFTGHFPGNPIFPGVLQIEAMAQCGGVFALSKVEEPHLYSTYFMKIDGVKFKSMVRPGDTVVFELNLLSPIRRGLVNMGGKGYVNGKVVVEAEMLAQVVKDKA